MAWAATVIASVIVGEHREDSVLEAHRGDRRDDDETTVSERLDQLECRLKTTAAPAPAILCR